MWARKHASTPVESFNWAGSVWVALLVVLLMSPRTDVGAASAAPAVEIGTGALVVDSAESKVHFDIGVLMVLRRSGTFSALEGSVQMDAAGRLANILIRIPTRSVRMRDPDQAALLLSPDFFDADAHPWIEFRSDSLPLESTKSRQVPGTLSIRGVERPVVFSVQADSCFDGPGLRRCHVRVEGTVKRSSFGMVGYKRTLADQVRLRIDVVLRPGVKKAAALKRALSRREPAKRARKAQP